MGIKMFDGEQAPNVEPPEQESNLPEELQGKSPDEMYELLKKEHENVVNKLKAEKFDQSTKDPKPTPQKQQGPSPHHPPTVGPGDGTGISYGGSKPPPDIYTDPEGFMEQQLNRRLQPLIQTQTHALRGANRQLFQQQIKDDWEKFGDEIEQFVDALHPQLQVDSRAYQQAYNYVRSLHLDEIVEEKSKSRSTETLATALADAGLEPEQIAAIVSRTGAGVVPQQKQELGSLFQSRTGIPVTASSVSSSRSDVPATGRGSRYTPQEKRMMEEFGMNPKEWDEYRAQNTDIVSSLED